MRVLVLEASTSAAKALVFDADGGVIAVESENYGPDVDMGGVHHADKVFDAVVRVGRKAAAGHDIAAVALSGVWHTIMALDADMRPASNVYLWNFTGTDAIARGVREQKDTARAIYRATGCMPNITYQPYALMFMRQNGLDLDGKLFASQAGYNFFRLTGDRIESRNIMSGMGFYDIAKGGYNNEIMDLCGVQASQFGRLGDYRDARPLTHAGAAALGIAAGVPVVPPHSDGALNQLGNGALRHGRMTFSVGTSAAIRLTTEGPVLSDPPATWCYAGVDGWISGAATNGAGNCVNWFKETLCADKWGWDELGSKLLDDGHTPVFLPFLFGERCPGWQDTRRGGFEELTAHDDPPVLFRAVCEGILFNVYQCYEILTAVSGCPDRIVLSGGILNSPQWVQMAADLFQRDLLVSDSPHASLLGGAALALHAAGGLDDLHSFGDESSGNVPPRPEAEAHYQAKYQRYLEWYQRGM